MCFLTLSLKAVYTKVRRTHKVRLGKMDVTTTASVQMAQPDDTSVEACKNYEPIFDQWSCPFFSFERLSF